MDEVNVRFAEQNKTANSRKQYDSSWKKWTVYIKENKSTKITSNYVFTFFRKLHEKGLALTTITTIKSQFC